MGLHPRLLHHILRGMGQFGDGRLSDKSVIRHDTFDGSAFCVLLQTLLCLVLGFRLRV